MRYTTYLFDFDYTLADSSRGIVTCFRNVLSRHGYIQVTDEEIKRTIGKTLQISFSILTGVTDAAQLEEFRKEYGKEADTHMTINTVLFLETKSVLIALKDAGARIGIISTKYRFRIKETLEQHFPGNFFDILIGGEDVQEPKPSPEGVLLAIKQLQVNKADTLYIGDSTVDAETAEAAGVDFAGITHGVTTAKELSQYPHKRIMNSLEELLEAEQPQDELSLADSTQALLQRKKKISSHRKKRANIFQILLLLILLYFGITEVIGSDPYIFLSCFALSLWWILQTRKLLPNGMTNFSNPLWMPIVTQLRILRIKIVRGKKKPAINNDICTCLNCNNTFIGNYCNHCGQGRNTSRYRMNNALRNILGGFFNIDSGFGRTLTELLYRPGHMIREFISGKRIHYFRPFQTLFVLAALYIMCVQLVDPTALNPMKEEPKTQNIENIESKTDSLSVAPTVNNNEDSFDDVLAKGMAATDRVKTRIQDIPLLMKVQHLLESWAHGNKALRIIATLPLFALATLLAFRRKRHKLQYNLTEHIFIQAYIACQIVLISIIILPFNGTARVDDLYEAPLWFIFLLFCWDYRQLHRYNWWKSFWCTLLTMVYTFLILIAFAFVLVSLIIVVIYLASKLGI